ncbi:hypothetical protein ACI2TO_23555 [Ralstonia nicotianae]
MFYGVRWVCVNADDQRSESGHKPLVWLRLQDVERVEVQPVGGGSSYWKVMLAANGQTYKYGETYLKHESASLGAFEVLAAIEKIHAGEPEN